MNESWKGLLNICRKLWGSQSLLCMHAQHTFQGKHQSWCEVWGVCSKFCVFWMLLQSSTSRMLSVEMRDHKEAVKFHSIISILLATWFSLPNFRLFNSAVVANSYQTWDVDVCKRVDVISWGLLLVSDEQTEERLLFMERKAHLSTSTYHGLGHVCDLCL